MFNFKMYLFSNLPVYAIQMRYIEIGPHTRDFFVYFRIFKIANTKFKGQ